MYVSDVTKGGLIIETESTAKIITCNFFDAVKKNNAVETEATAVKVVVSVATANEFFKSSKLFLHTS